MVIDLEGPEASSLRRRALTLIRIGQLPAVRPREVAAGKGPALCCALCSSPISEDDLRYVVEPEPRRICFHVDCYLVWETVSAYAA